MKGRKPLPANLQRALGDPSKRGPHKVLARVQSEARGVRGLPECPEHLKGHARKAWNFFVEQLEVMELDRQPDAAILEGACVHWARAVDADKIIAKEGLEAVNVKFLRISRDCWMLVGKFCSEFGFSPVARTRIAASGAPPAVKDDLDALLSAPRTPRVQPEAVN